MPTSCQSATWHIAAVSLFARLPIVGGHPESRFASSCVSGSIGKPERCAISTAYPTPGGVVYVNEREKFAASSLTEPMWRPPTILSNIVPRLVRLVT
jgi:hypothetical protein